MRKYMLDRYNRRREQGITQLGGKCVNCASTIGLQFDHIDPSTKLFTLAKGSSYSETRWQAELIKCQLLCGVCHEKKSAKDANKEYVKGTNKHGTLSTYRYCKCGICRSAWASHNKEYRAKRNKGV